MEKTAGMRGPLHCVIKHLANARVHIQEALSDIEDAEIRTGLKRAIKIINDLLEDARRHFSGERTDTDAMDATIVFLRRAIHSLIEERAKDIPKIAWEELTYAVGHLDNAHEHLAEDTHDARKGAPKEVRATDIAEKQG